jgi:hypothetical protein
MQGDDVSRTHRQRPGLPAAKKKGDAKSLSAVHHCRSGTSTSILFDDVVTLSPVRPQPERDEGIAGGVAGDSRSDLESAVIDELQVEVEIGGLQHADDLL